MDKADFSERKASEQWGDFPDDGGSSQTKLHADHNFSFENIILGVSDHVIPTAEAAHEGTCRKASAALTLGNTTEHAAKKNWGAEQCCSPTLPIPAKNGERSPAGLSAVLQQHLSREELWRGHCSPCNTRPGVSGADGLDEAIMKSIILHYVRSFWAKEPSPEFTDQLTPPGEDGLGREPRCSPTTTAEDTAEMEEPVAAGRGSRPPSSTFLTAPQSPSHKHSACQERKLQTGNSRSGFGFQYGQVCSRFSDRSGVAPPGKIPKNNPMGKPLPTDRQASFSPERRARLALGQDIPEGTARPDCAEKEKQGRKIGDPSQQAEMQPAAHSHQEPLTGTGPKTRLWKLSSASQKDLFLSSSIFQKISQGKEMCQKLKEQTDQLKTKVQEFSRSLAQDSHGNEQDERLELEKLQAHLELLKQEFVAEEQLTLEQQVHRPTSPAVGNFDPQRKAEGDVSRLKKLLEDGEGQVDEGTHTSAGSLPESSPTLPDDLPSASSPPPDEDPRHARASGRQRRAETSGRSCAFCHRVLEWKQSLEKKGRRPSCGEPPAALQEKAPPPDSLPSSDTGLSGSPAPGAGLQSNPCETCGTRTPTCPGGGRKEPPKEFHYRYNTPGQNYLHHSEGRAFVQVRFLNENRSSPPSYSKPNWICSQRAHSKPSQAEREPKPGKKKLKTPMTSGSDLATSSPHFQSSRVSGSKSLSDDVSSDEEAKSENLSESLDHALKTAAILKETTDEMIRTITEDLAKLQKWRNRLKY